MKMKRQVALLVISALLIGLLPMGNATVSKAANTSASTAGYGLNNPTTDSNGVTTWDCVWFGNYWQEDTNGDGKADKNDAKQPIKWRVLSVNGDDAFLLADKNLDVQRYNDTYTSVTWETCTMRSWLNGYGAASNKEGKDYAGSNFLDYAFSFAEQSAIRTTNVVNDDNSYYGTEGGNDTSDKVYLLSLDEVMNPAYGFTSTVDSTKTRQAVNTSYVAAGGEIKSSGMYSAGSTDVWWLRSPGGSSSIASDVDDSGHVNRGGVSVNYSYSAARPALHLNLSSTSSWSYAGTVTSEGGEIGSATPVPTAGSSGLTCTPNLTIDVGSTRQINAQVYAETQEDMISLSSAVSWESSDSSVVEVENGGFIQSTSPTQYSGESGTASLWWATGLVSVRGKKAGTAVVTGKLTDGTAVSCQVTVNEPEVSGSDDTEGTGGSFVLGEEKEGSADDGKGVAQFFPASWSLKSSKYPVQMSQTENTDGSYTLKASIGIGRSDLLDNDTEWSKYKKACETANKNSGSYDTLASYRDMFGLKSSTAIHSSGWKGSGKPSLSVMGYVEYKYDKYGNTISAAGKIAGDLKWSGDISWQFATPIGPMYLKLGAEGKASLEGGPSWDNKEKKASLDGKLTITPSISLTGGYGIDKVASLSATGKASVAVQAYPPSKGTFTAEASVNVYALFIIDYTWTLAKYTKPIWDTTSKIRIMQESQNSVGESTSSFINTEFAKEDTGWMGNLKKSRAGTQEKIVLQNGLLPSSLPMLTCIGDKQVMVWQGYDEKRDVANSTVLLYSVYENGSWSEPKAVYDDGYGDACADMQVIGGKLCLTWQKQKADVSSENADETMARMGECAEIFYAQFDSESDTFTDITQVTDNDVCDMMPRFVDGSDEICVAWVRNDANSVMQSEGTNMVNASVWNGNGFDAEQELVEAPGTVERFVCYEQDNEIKAVYVTKANGIIAVGNSDNTVEDALSELMQMAEDGTIPSIDYVDGQLRFISNGMLYRYDSVREEMVSCGAGNSSFDGTAVYCTNGTKSGYVWSTYDEERDTGSIMASMETDTGYSDPVMIYEIEGEISRHMAPVLAKDGEWNIALNQEATESGTHSLAYLCQKESRETSLISAYLDENDLSDGETAVEYVITNTGDTSVDEITVQITLADGTVVRKTVQETVYPGETSAGTVYMDLSQVKEGQDIRIAVYESGQIPDGDDIVSDQMEQSNVSLVGTAIEGDDGILVTAYVTNKGEREAKAALSLFGETEKQNQLASQMELDIAAGATESVNFTIAPSQIHYGDNGAAYLTLCADIEGGDYDMSDNTAYLALYEGEVINANTEEKNAKDPVTKPSDSSPSPSPAPEVTFEPTPEPTEKPSVPPTDSPLVSPAATPDVEATVEPGGDAIPTPTIVPTAKPSTKPTTTPGAQTPFVPAYPSQTFTPVLRPTASPTATSVGRVTSIKLTQKKRTVTALWKKVPGADGYQIWYSTLKKWKGKKQKLLRKNKVTVKNLKKKKTYYFRVRAYQLDDEEKVYGAWSKTKKIKMKK